MGSVKKKETDGEHVIRWINTVCRIPEGRMVGERVKLRPWQEEEILRIYDNPAGTRRAIISLGRKNAKTTLAAFLLLVHLCGPQHRLNSQLYSAAQSREQASILFSLAAKVVRMSPDLREAIVIRDTAKQLFCPELGTLYRALSSEGSTAYGLSPVFIVHDELGQVKGPTSEIYDALETATAAQENPLSIVISTQAPTDADLMSILIDDALQDHDPRVVVSLFTADANADPFDEATIRQANPAFGDFQSASEVLAMAEDARRMPSRESQYRNLVLNQRVETSDPFISPSVWTENSAAPTDDWDGRDVYGGLDLSETSDLTAFVLICPIDKRIHVRPTFWLPDDGLLVRSRKDRVPYDQWHREGFLETTPGRSIEYEMVAKRIVDTMSEFNVRKIAFDRWNMKHLVPWLVKAGLSLERVEALFEPFGQGFQSMSPALNELETMLRNGRVNHGGHPVLTMCARNSIVNRDPAGGRKLDKKKSRGRIDGMVALAMAASVAAAEMNEAPVEIEYVRGELFA
jgi:phage terminase large subunit-like protein